MRSVAAAALAVLTAEAALVGFWVEGAQTKGEKFKVKSHQFVLNLTMY